MKPRIALCLMMLLPALAVAGDPTRPPEGWGLAAAGQPQAAGGLHLQSVLLPERGGRPVAVIGGRTVALGGHLGELTLIRLDEREAVLRGPEGLLRLFLTPDVDKQLIAPPPRKAPAAGKMKEAR